MKLLSLVALLLMVAAAGCGPSGPPPQSTDPAAIERENTVGKEIRGQLEK